jgi:hypothetical protein
MNVIYTIDDAPGSMLIPATYLLVARAEDLAELVTSDYWRSHPAPPESCLVHLHNVDNTDLGIFEVWCETRPIYFAKAVDRT